MPIYEYQCEGCEHEFETLQKMSEAPLIQCPSCGKDLLRKKISAVAFRLKGGGWYETDFKSGDKKNVASTSESGGDSTSSEGSQSKNDAKGESKPKGDGKSNGSTEGGGGGASAASDSASKTSSDGAKESSKKSTKSESSKATTKSESKSGGSRDKSTKT